jgi:hypothetical protein
VTEVERLRHDLAIVRTTLATVRRERDHAHLLLRALRIVGAIPSMLRNPVNNAVALESEGDIDRAKQEADKFLAGLLERNVRL